MSHHCHALGCAKPCPPRHLMCRACWALVPPDLQREVNTTCKARDRRAVDATWAPWWRAAHRAIYHVGKIAHPAWSQADAWLAKEMAIADRMERQ